MNKIPNSIQLPISVMRRVSRAAKSANRTPSDLAAEALQWYLRMRRVPEETATPAELRAIHRGRQAFQRGEYTTLDEFRSKNHVVRRPRKPRTKVS